LGVRLVSLKAAGKNFLLFSNNFSYSDLPDRRVLRSHPPS
jgi:hypothetical protein